jgi:hypothetical protein
MTEREIVQLGRTLQAALDATTSLGPRIGALETWRNVLDAPEPVGGLPIRMQTLEGVIRDLRASWTTFRAFAAVTAAAVSLLTLYAYVHGGL